MVDLLLGVEGLVVHVMVNHWHSPETEVTPEDPGRLMERIQDETKRRKEKRKIRR